MAYKTDLINHVQQTLGGTKKDAEQAVNTVLNAIQEVTIQEGKLLIKDHGSYEVRSSKARKGKVYTRINPLPLDHITASPLKPVKPLKMPLTIRKVVT